MSKANRAAAKDWHADQKAKKYADQNFSDEREKLRYAGCKRDQMPDPAVFEVAGYPGCAQKIRQALRLLDEAHDDIAHVQIGEDDD